jgi:DMSO reductase anchor subunit
MTKCDFCLDHLEQGLPPACVAACPLRVLDYGEMRTDQGIALWNAPSETHPFPLPSHSHTQPRLAVKPHAAMRTTETKCVANLEEIQPRTPSGWEDVPLILFTLLAQLAVGGFWEMSWMFPPLWALLSYDTTRLRLLPALLIGVCFGAGLLASFAHLGTKKNAWRALGHLRKSWLSREILFAGLFGLGWSFTTAEILIAHRTTFEWTAITSIFGIGLIYSMSQVYRLASAPGWNTDRTNAGFLISALLLGQSAMAFLVAYEAQRTGLRLFPGQWAVIGSGILVLLLAQLALMRKKNSLQWLQNIRMGLIVVGLVLTAASFFQTGLNLLWLGALIFLIVAAQESLGRWLFFQSRL